MKIFLSFSILILTSITVFATHIIGGEFSYKNLGGNQYELTLRMYRDCQNGIPLFDVPTSFTIFDSSNNVVMVDTFHFASDTIIPFQSLSSCVATPPVICVEEGTFIAYVTLPASPGGYTLCYKRCCRNATIVNISTPGMIGETFFTEISDDAIALQNNSPVFQNYPTTFLCVNELYVYDNSAIDIDGDSLSYHLYSPFVGASQTNVIPIPAFPPPYISVSYNIPYSFTYPMDGNQGLSIDSTTGELTIIPSSLGQFVVGVCVDEFRNGIFLGRHYRDFQFNVINCDSCVGFTSIVQNNNVQEGAAAQFSINPSSTTEQLRWQENSGSGYTDLSDGGQYSGTQTSTLIISNVQVSQQGNKYRCHGFTDSCSVITNTGMLSVSPNIGIEMIWQNDFQIQPTIISAGTEIQIINSKIGNDLKLVDCTGRILAKQKITSSSLTLQTQNLSSGIYFISCGNAVRKLVVVR
ncbi:MAG: T9SS type A sorting domain-containing protein [Bacteroidota bacterium]